ncbi:MAG: type II toxin-antitoxin system HicA family toxin [Ktedonobacterales bacterium]
MSKLPAVRPSDAIAALRRAGFRPVRQSGSHLFLINDQTGRKTSVAIHAEDLKAGTLHGILRQAGLSREDFIRLLR